MRKLIDKIKQFVATLKKEADWYFRKKEFYEYVVTKSLGMPTLKGMKTFGKIETGKISVFVSEKQDGYRTMKPLMIRKFDRDDFQVFTEHLNFDIKRTK